jgi:hypothetical protein
MSFCMPVSGRDPGPRCNLVTSSRVALVPAGLHAWESIYTARTPCLSRRSWKNPSATHEVQVGGRECSIPCSQTKEKQSSIRSGSHHYDGACMAASLCIGPTWSYLAVCVRAQSSCMHGLLQARQLDGQHPTTTRRPRL